MKEVTEPIITYVISLDSKARLVLPLEIREFLGIAKNERIIFRTCQNNTNNTNISTYTVYIEKAPLDVEARLVSKNCGYLGE